MEEKVEVPLWVLKEINDALRMVASSYHCADRNTCLKRSVMLAYNMTSQLYNSGKYQYSEDHYESRGQTPE